MDAKTPIKTDREKVNLWLDHINETDEACRAEVLQACSDDKLARAYYIFRYTKDCACKVQSIKI